MIFALALLAAFAASQQPATPAHADAATAMDQSAQSDSAAPKQQTPATGTVKKPPGRPKAPKTPSLADELVEKALGARAVTPPPMDTAISLAAAYAYRSKNTPRAKGLLEDAYLTLRDLKSDKPDIDILKLDIVLQTCNVDPLFAEAYLPDDDNAKEFVLQKLIDVYSSKRDYKKALQLFSRVDHKEWAARPLLERLPKEMDDERERVFSEALSSYRQKQHKHMEIHQQDFGELVVRNWQRLPSNLVLDAIDMLLANADPHNASADNGTKQQGIVAVSNSTTHLRFDSYYEYRVFQFLPILRELDHSRADALLLQMNQLGPILDQYPDGLSSIDASLKQESGDASDDATATRYAIVNSATAAGLVQQDELDVTLDRLQRVADQNPRAAVGEAHGIRDPYIRVSVLQDLARRLLEKAPEASYDALTTLGREYDKKLARDWKFRNEALLLAMKLPSDIPPSRKEGLEQELLRGAQKAILAVYDDDKNPENPNQAIKLYWPSTLAWNELFNTAAKMGPSAVKEVLQDVSDPEILPIEQAFAAAALNGMSPWRDESPHVVRKQPMKLASVVQ